MKLFIGNLATDASEDDLQKAAEAFGTVSSVSIAQDDAGASKGHGFVEMANKAEGEAAIAGLNGKELKGQALKVSEARPDKRSQGPRGAAGTTGFGGRPNQASGPKGGSAKGGSSKSGFQIGKSSGHKV